MFANACLQEPGAARERGSNNKVLRNKSDVKGKTPHANSRGPALSQSLSFPAKGIRASGMKKSVDGIPIKADSKHARGSGPSVSSGPVSRHVTSQSSSKETTVNGNKSSFSRGSAADSTGFQRSSVRRRCHRIGLIFVMPLIFSLIFSMTLYISVSLNELSSLGKNLLQQMLKLMLLQVNSPCKSRHTNLKKYI